MRSRLPLMSCLLVLCSCVGADKAPSIGTTTSTTTPATPNTSTTTSTSQTSTTTTTTTTTTTPQIYELEVTLTVDDAWELWVDGVAIDTQTGWNFANTNNTVVNLNTDGPHVVAVHGYDLFNVISGFMAEVKLNGAVIGLTGSGSWRHVGSTPPAGWTDPWFDDSTWTAPQLCDATDVSTYWQDRPTVLTSVGAQWVWPRPCRDLGHGWYRLNFFIQ